MAGWEIKGAEASNGRAMLTLRSGSGDMQLIETEHVIAATGYRPDVSRLPFLSAAIMSQLKLLDSVPVLSSYFESSVPGLFFVGWLRAVASVPSFASLVGGSSPLPISQIWPASRGREKVMDNGTPVHSSPSAMTSAKRDAEQPKLRFSSSPRQILCSPLGYH